MNNNVKRRIYGEGHPIMREIRNRESLRSTGSDFSFVCTDVDCLAHIYKSRVEDNIGTRRLQMMWQMEIKTHGARPSFSQQDTFWQHHRFCYCPKGKDINNKRTYHYGVLFLSVNNTCIADSTRIEWGKFTNPEINQIAWTDISALEHKSSINNVQPVRIKMAILGPNHP